MTDEMIEKLCEAAWDDNQHATHLKWAAASREHHDWANTYRSNMRAALAALSEMGFRIVKGENVAGVASGSQWKCKARQSSVPEPQDCDWPVCGCDPYADKVIAALQESGKL